MLIIVVEAKGTNKRQMPVFQRSSSMISVFKVSSDLKVIYQLSWYSWLISRGCDSILNSHSKPEAQRHAIWFWLLSLLEKTLFWSFIGTSFHVIFYPCAPFGSVGSHHILQLKLFAELCMMVYFLSFLSAERWHVKAVPWWWWRVC